MKVLLLVIKHQKANLDSFYEGISTYADVDLRRLDNNQLSNLKLYSNTINPHGYDRIILFLRFNREMRQVGFVRTILNLVILEHDVWTNYYAKAKYHGKFSIHYRDLPWARVLVSNYQHAQDYRLSPQSLAMNISILF